MVGQAPHVYKPAPGAGSISHAPGRSAFLLAACISTLGIACEPVPDETMCATTSALLGATEASQAQAAEIAHNVGFLLIDTDVRTSPSQVVHLQRICTVARIAPGLAVTAAHCIADLPAFNAAVGFGPVVPGELTSHCPAAAVFPVGSWLRGPGDLLAVRFQDASDAAGIGVRNAPMEIGQAALLAGYGVAEDAGSAGQRRFANALVTRVADISVTVQVTGGGACSGDSGGPMLVQTASGSIELGGVLSRGSPSCKGEDEYIAASVIRDWLPQTLSP